MAIIDKLKTNGSIYSNFNGGPTPDNQLSLKQSQVHYQYSINNNPNLNIPFTSPSNLDLNGINPVSANKDVAVNPVNDTFSKGTYKNNAPEGKSF